jgi:hypothetical protein
VQLMLQALLLICLPARGDPFEPDQVSRFDPTFQIGRGGHVANRSNSNLGNGILRPETFGKTHQVLPLRIAGPPLRPVFGEANY